MNEFELKEKYQLELIQAVTGFNKDEIYNYLSKFSWRNHKNRLEIYMKFYINNQIIKFSHSTN